MERRRPGTSLSLPFRRFLADHASLAVPRQRSPSALSPPGRLSPIRRTARSSQLPTTSLAELWWGRNWWPRASRWERRRSCEGPRRRRAPWFSRTALARSESPCCFAESGLMGVSQCRVWAQAYRGSDDGQWEGPRRRWRGRDEGRRCCRQVLGDPVCVVPLLALESCSPSFIIQPHPMARLPPASRASFTSPSSPSTPSPIRSRLGKPPRSSRCCSH